MFVASVIDILISLAYAARNVYVLARYILAAAIDDHNNNPACMNSCAFIAADPMICLISPGIFSSPPLCLTLSVFWLITARWVNNLLSIFDEQ